MLSCCDDIRIYLICTAIYCVVRSLVCVCVSAFKKKKEKLPLCSKIRCKYLDDFISFRFSVFHIFSTLVVFIMEGESLHAHQTLFI